MQGRTSGNMIVVGRTGMGKTVLMNLLVFNHIINHRKIIWIDPENKNYALTRYIGGSYISFGNSDKIINIFDLKPISSDDENMPKEEMYNTKMRYLMWLRKSKLHLEHYGHSLVKMP